MFKYIKKQKVEIIIIMSHLFNKKANLLYLDKIKQTIKKNNFKYKDNLAKS